jgi:hypothetical protein
MKYTIALLVTVILSSCSTPHGYVSREHKKSVNRARRLLDKKIEASQQQFAIVNNQIIMFENGVQ